MSSCTYLLYSDKRVNLQKKALDYAKSIFKEQNLDYIEQDVAYYDELRMNDVRLVISKSSESSYSGIKILILNMENIRNDAANALLKVIEEPTKGTYFLLLTHTMDKLPKTILSRAIKIYVESKKYDIDQDIYNLFDGDNDYLDEYVEKKLNIDEYSNENFLDSIIEYLNGNVDIVNKIKYEIAIRYLVNNLKFLEYKKKLDIIQKLCDILSKDRNLALKFLKRVLIVSRYKLSGKKYIYLTNLKNSLKNNVSVNACIYIFFNELLGG